MILTKWKTLLKRRGLMSSAIKGRKTFLVSRYMLNWLLKNSPECLELHVQELFGRKPILTPNSERLVEYILFMSRYYGLVRSDVRKMAYQLALEMKKQAEFGRNTFWGDIKTLCHHADQWGYRRFVFQALIVNQSKNFLICCKLKWNKQIILLKSFLK